MTTTELIKLLQKHEKSAATGRSREVDFMVNGEYLLETNIIVDSTGDGIRGAFICLRLDRGTT